MKNSILILTFLAILNFMGCKDTPKTDKPATTKVVKSNAPVFNSDSAYQYIVDQVAFGPRVPNTDGHIACGKFLVESFKAMGLTVYEQDFMATAYDGTQLSSKNIIASINPKAQKRILLAAHWDTRPYADQEKDLTKQLQPIDGANDGGSGVGVLMEIARAIQSADKMPNVGIDIILFDSEDYGAPQFYKGEENTTKSWCLGSQYWGKNKHLPDYHAYYGILLDMVGSKDATYYREGGSMYYAAGIVNKVWNIGQSLGYNKHFINKNCNEITDDHIYVNTLTGIPMIDIIHYNHANERRFFGEYWHTHDDNINVIDKETLQALGHTLLEVLYSEK